MVPVLNEEDNVKPLYEKVKAVLDRLKIDYEIVFVDDGSEDATFRILNEMHKKDKKLKIVKMRRNFGQSAAISAGFEHSKGAVIIAMDGDLQNDPEDIPRLLNKLEEGYDIVSGWRFERKDPFSKKLFSKFSNFLRNFLLGDPIHDSGCTLKAYRKECIEELELYGEMHRYIPSILRRKGFKVTEIKVKHHQRMFGKTKYGFSRIMKGFLDLINIWFWRKFSSRPLHIFGGFGILLIIIGFLSGIYLIFLRLFFTFSLTTSQLPLLSVLLVIIGIQFFVSGILADMIIKTYYSHENKKVYFIEKFIE